MKLTTSFLLPAFIGAASAISDASVYILDASNGQPAANPPTLTPEQARLVFAQRLDASQYHGIGDASESTLSHINKFGGRQGSLFQDVVVDEAAELVLVVEGVSFEKAEPLLKELASTNPAFTISKVPSMAANKKLIEDLQKQSGYSGQNCPLEDAVNPFDTNCWFGKSNVVHFDLLSNKGESKIDELMSAHKRLVRFAQKGEMETVLVLMPESSRTSKSPAKPYGSYESPSRVSISNVRRQAAEEPMTESPVASAASSSTLKQIESSTPSKNSTIKPLPKLPPLCYASQDICMSSTNNCTGHGICYKKYSTTKAACFTCGCHATNETFSHNKQPRYTTVNWGGSACHKRDVSSPFWLISIFTVVMVGVVSWGIGLMYSIGEEKLPGVIGAGVSSKVR